MKSKWQKWLKINVAAILAAIVMFTTAYGSVDSVDSTGQSDPAGSAELSYSGGQHRTERCDQKRTDTAF